LNDFKKFNKESLGDHKFLFIDKMTNRGEDLGEEGRMIFRAPEEIPEFHLFTPHPTQLKAPQAPSRKRG